MGQLSLAWQEIGFIRWPLLLSFLVVVSLGIWSTTRLFGPEPSPDMKTKAWLDAILFWGGFAMISGVLGTLVGITIAAQVIEGAGEVSTTLIWGGVKVAMLSSILGLLLLAFSSLLWFTLQLRWRFLSAESHAN